MSTQRAAVAVDRAAGSLGAAEHLVHDLDEALAGLFPGEDHIVSTHTVREPVGRFVAVVSWSDGPEPGEVAARLRAALSDAVVDDSGSAVEEARHRTAGRLARYPGRSLVERRTTPAEAVAASCLDAVEGLAGTVVTPDTGLDLTGFARPVWRDGRCVLLVQQGADALIPFEVRHQTACCSDH
ncbi:hypothetical protein [Streptomyces sp. NPDC002644]